VDCHIARRGIAAESDSALKRWPLPATPLASPPSIIPGGEASLHMGDRVRHLAAFLVVSLLAGGCESFDVLSPQRTGALIRTIQLGMTEEEVTAYLGKPQKQEVRGETKFLFYATAWQVAEKAKTRSPIAIRDGNVVGMGSIYLAKFSPPNVKWDAWVMEVRPQEHTWLTYTSALPTDQ
jgi:hypothetical protein